MDRKQALADHCGMVGRPRNPSRKGREAPPRLFIGQWIRALGSRPIDVVRATGINEGYLSQLINGGKTNPRVTTLIEIAKFLDVPLDYLYRPPPSREFVEQAAGLDPAILARLRFRQ